MDYEKEYPTDISYDLDVALPYGEMPDEALMAKFESTNDGSTEYDYHYFARNNLKDRRPDNATFAHEEPRKSISNKGYLNLVHYGGRGGDESPAHPEIFTGFTETEPRRTATDPDYNELRLQHDSRMRFVRWDNGNSDHSISDGRWRDNQIRDAKKQMFKEVKPRMRIFTTAKDGRREGLRRSFQHKSLIERITDSKKYGDLIKSDALNPTRKTASLSNHIHNGLSMYNRHAPDHEFEVAKYGFDTRKRKLNSTENKIQMYEGQSRYDSEVILCDAEKSAAYKSIGVLMGKAVNCKKMQANDVEYAVSNDAQIRKLGEIKGEIEQTLVKIKHETDLKQADDAQVRKYGAKQGTEHMNNMQTPDSSKPDSHLFNAQLMYKALKPGADYTAIKRQIKTDDKSAKLLLESKAKKSGLKNAKTGQRNNKAETYTESMETHKYKTSKRLVAKRKDMTNGEGFAQISKEYQVRKRPHSEMTNPNTDFNEADTDFEENRHIDLLPGGGKFGKKRNARLANRTQHDTINDNDMMA